MFILKANQQVALSVAYKDKRGNNAFVDGFPTWAVSDETLGTIEAGSTPFTVTVKAVGTPGSFQVSVIADADRGEGIQNIVGVLDIEVIPGDASVVAIGTGIAEDQPEPEPEPEVPVEPEPEVPVEPEPEVPVEPEPEVPVEPEPEVPVEPEPEVPVEPEPEVPVEPEPEVPVEPEPEVPVEPEPEVPVEPEPEDPIIEG